MEILLAFPANPVLVAEGAPLELVEDGSPELLEPPEPPEPPEPFSAKPTAAGVNLKTLYTFLRKVSPIMKSIPVPILSWGVIAGNIDEGVIFS